MQVSSYVRRGARAAPCREEAAPDPGVLRRVMKGSTMLLSPDNWTEWLDGVYSSQIIMALILRYLLSHESTSAVQSARSRWIKYLHRICHTNHGQMLKYVDARRRAAMASYCLMQRLLIFGRGSIQIATISDRQIRYRTCSMHKAKACHHCSVQALNSHTTRCLTCC